MKVKGNAVNWVIAVCAAVVAACVAKASPIDGRAEELLSRMTLEEKIGRLWQTNGVKADVLATVAFSAWMGSVSDSGRKLEWSLSCASSIRTEL